MWVLGFVRVSSGARRQVYKTQVHTAIDPFVNVAPYGSPYAATSSWLRVQQAHQQGSVSESRARARRISAGVSSSAELDPIHALVSVASARDRQKKETEEARKAPLAGGREIGTRKYRYGTVGVKGPSTRIFSSRVGGGAASRADFEAEKHNPHIALA